MSLLGGTRAGQDPCAERQMKELISSGKARNDDNFYIIYWEGMPRGAETKCKDCLYLAGHKE